MAHTNLLAKDDCWEGVNEGDGELEVIEDSEPEREQMRQRRFGPPCALAAPTNGTNHPTAATSHHFATPKVTAEAPASVPSRRVKPWERPTAAIPPAATISRSTSFPPSASTSSSTRKPKRHHSFPAAASTSSSTLLSSSGFQSASSLLRRNILNNVELDSDEDRRDDPRRPPLKKVKRSKPISGPPQPKPSSLKILKMKTKTVPRKVIKPVKAIVEVEMLELDDSGEDSEVILPLGGCNGLGSSLEIVDCASEEDENGRNNVETEDDEDVEQDELASTTEEEEMTPVERLRTGLTKFRYNFQVLAPNNTGNFRHCSSTYTTTKPIIKRQATSTVAPRPPKPAVKKSASKPSCSTRSSTSSSAVKPSATLPFAKSPPIDLPPKERISVLTSCPLGCSSPPWATSKSLASKTTHLLSCASTQAYTAETVRVLSEAQILASALGVLRAKRDIEMSRSLLERVVGAGEGKISKAEVVVVGWSGGNIEEAQAEFDEMKRKPASDRVVRIAKEITAERAAREEVELARKRREKVEKEEEDGKEGEEKELVMPRPTGFLNADVEGNRRIAAERMDDLLLEAGGTGLTQIVGVTLPKRSLAQSDSIIIIDDDLHPPAAEKEVKSTGDNDGDDWNPEVWLEPPPATQNFAESKLARKLIAKGKVEVVAMPLRADRFTSVPLSRRGSEGDERLDGSYWSAQGGQDEAFLHGRGILSSSASMQQKK